MKVILVVLTFLISASAMAEMQYFNLPSVTYGKKVRGASTDRNILMEALKACDFELRGQTITFEHFGYKAINIVNCKLDANAPEADWISASTTFIK